MRTDIDHLPAALQDELARVRETLIDEFAVSIAGATQPWKKNGKIQKIVLFGSYSRDDWIDEAENGYQSDFDILIVVSHKNLTDVAEYWYVAEDKIQRDRAPGEHHCSHARRGEPGPVARRVFLGRYRARRHRALRAIWFRACDAEAADRGARL